MMSSLIQGSKIPGNVTALDFNGSYTHIAVGGRESIRIFELRLQDKCWLECKKSIAKYRGTSITKTCVNQMAWNKYGSDLIAIGTTSGYVVVYDVGQSYKNILQLKEHDGNINNIEWNMGSRDNFVSSSFENYVLQWDPKINSEKPVAKYQYSQNTKIRDLKFSPHNPFLLAVQSSTKLQITDLRKSNQIVCSYDIHDNQLQGIGVQWDPNNENQIASAISKDINIFEINGEKLQLKSTVSHYSLIKSFYWMKTKQNHFGILGEHPEKNIFFYDLQDKNKISYMYGGHTRSIDCWKMNKEETLLLSASNIRQRSGKGPSAGTNTYGFLVSQYTDNFYDPNQSKFNYPISFDNDNNIAFCLTQEQNAKKSLQSISSLTRKKSSRIKQTSPIFFNCTDSLQWEDHQIKIPSIKEQFLFLHKNYLLEGKNEDISLNNAAVAKRIGKNLCSSVWSILFLLAFPVEQVQHTIESFYQQKIQADIEIIENRVFLFNKEQLVKKTKKIQVLQLLQELVDQNQLQTAVFASRCLMNKNPSLIPDQFMHRIFTPYIELLHSFQLYNVAAETILQTKNKAFTDITQRNTTFTIICGWCKQSISKGNCKCNKLCVICQGSLSERMVIWCKYCGHGGHATQYYKWFKQDKKQFCPHGCGHNCFTSDDF